MDKKLIRKFSAIALNDVFGYEPRFPHQIIDTLGSPESVFSIPEEERRLLFGPFSKYTGRINDSCLESAEKQYYRLRAEGFQIIDITDSAYPPLLRECEDCPVVLYIRSETPAGHLFASGQAVSIVGTRDLSLYGREWCTRIVKAISEVEEKATIVSGLAIGIDITAHLSALAYGLPTVAVLPVGINEVYPKRHSVIAEKIAGSPGSALISDFPPDTGAAAFNFLRRNRIIAGLSQSTILVESKFKGGGTMTARLASGYQRNVFALPGRIDDERSAGCNRLLREKLAEPLDSLDNLTESLGLGKRNFKKAPTIEESVRERYSGRFDDAEVQILSGLAVLIKERRGISMDEICRCTGMTYQDVSVKTGILENDRFISIDLLQRCSINAGI